MSTMPLPQPKPKVDANGMVKMPPPSMLSWQAMAPSPFVRRERRKLEERQAQDAADRK